MEEVIFKEQIQIAVVFILQLVYLSLEQLLRTVNHLIQFIQSLSHLLRVGTLYVASELLYLLVDQLANFVHLRLQLHQSRIIVYVFVHLLILACFDPLEACQPQPCQLQCFFTGLVPADMFWMVPFIDTLTLLAQQFEMIASWRAANGDYW